MKTMSVCKVLLLVAAAAAGDVVVDINGLGKVQGNSWPDSASEEFLGEARYTRFSLI